MLNSHEHILICSPRLHEQQLKNIYQKCKARVTFGTMTAKKEVFGLFLIIVLATNITMQKHRTNLYLKLYQAINELVS